MAMERVPYLVGGGFEHSAEVMRAMLAAATSGAEGIVNAGDFKVRPLAVPGTSVRVAPGNALIRNSYGGGGAQTYACRAGSETPVPFEAARFEVISGVASDQKDLSGLGLSYPAIPLARLNVPPSTGTITESMITDLRSIALPRVQRHLFTYALRTGESDRLLGPVGDVEGEAWPNHYWYFNIPSWAQ